MVRYLVCVCALAASANAQSTTAGQLLEKVRSAYSSIKAVHLLVQRDESGSMSGRLLSTSSECELAGAPGNRYYARFKTANEEAVVVSDGSTIWRALTSKKQWTKISGASLETDHDEDEKQNPAAHDLHR